MKTGTAVALFNTLEALGSVARQSIRNEDPFNFVDRWIDVHDGVTTDDDRSLRFRAACFVVLDDAGLFGETS